MCVLEKVLCSVPGTFVGGITHRGESKLMQQSLLVKCVYTRRQVDVNN